MRPDTLAIYIFLCEAQRLSKIKPWRRFKPAILKTADVLTGQLPLPQPVPQKLSQLVELYRRHLDAEDIREVAQQLGLAAVAEELVQVLAPRLGDIFASCLEWHDDASVTARFGETAAQTLCSEIPFDEYGRLEGTVSYGDEKYRFHRGIMMPQDITIELIDAVEGDTFYHAALVDLFGVEEYLLASARTQRETDGDLELLRTDRYAMVRVDGELRPCSTKLDLAGVKLWLESLKPPVEHPTGSAEGVPADPPNEAVPDA